MKHARIAAPALGTRRSAAWAAVLGAGLFATLVGTVVARDLVQKSRPGLEQPFASWLPQSSAQAIFLMTALALALGVASFFLFSRFSRIDAALARLAPKGPLALRIARRDIVVAGLVIFVCWLPLLAVMYPCGMPVDTYNQLYQFESSAPTFYPTTREVFDAELIDHHPVFDTLLYGLFWKAGFALGNQKAGLFALVVAQSLVLAAELGFSVCYLERLGTPWLLRLASLLFAALFPFFGLYAATILKDVTYLTVFLPWTLIWLEAARTRCASLKRPGTLAAFMVLGALCILTKKLGLFVLVPCLVALVAAARGLRVRLALGSLATIAFSCLLVPAVVYPLIGGVQPGGRQESLGPIIQHLTALAIEEPDAFTQDEVDALYNVFYFDLAQKRYESYRSDGAKGCFRDSAQDEDIAAMMAIWARKGLEHPLVYLKSTMQTCGMLFVPYMKITHYFDEDYSIQKSIYCGYDPSFADVDVSQTDEAIALNHYLVEESPLARVSDLPVISILFTEGFYGSWVPFVALVCLLLARAPVRGRLGASRSPYLLLGLVPTFVSMAFFLVSPVASPRYVLHLMFTAPLLLGWGYFALSCAHGRTAATGLGNAPAIEVPRGSSRTRADVRKGAAL